MQNVLISGDTRYPINRKVVRKAVSDTLRTNKIADAEVSVFVVGNRKMRELRDKYMKDNADHEVMSFPLEEITHDAVGGFISPPDGILRLGDIVLCWPQVLLLASSQESMVDDKVYSLVAHSVEHLLGKHHEGY